MKINVELDCTPEEARRFIGLPDVEQANAMYMDNLMKLMKGATSFEQLQNYANSIAPMGQMGIKLFRNLMESGAAFTAGASGGTSKKS